MRTLIVVLLVAFVAAEQMGEAEAFPGLGQGQVDGNRPPSGYQNPQVNSPLHPHFNHPIHKRGADPGHDYKGYYGYGVPYGHYGYPYGYYGHGATYGYQTTVHHPGYGVSYQYNHGLVPAYYW
ncbi:uncharacterized protein [Panulirus ornatus]|uniref:uncharacterized protein n=1 Tax=Panulirus ornatus TaxID=150431 RepID=UPI003A89C7D0